MIDDGFVLWQTPLKPFSFGVGRGVKDVCKNVHGSELQPLCPLSVFFVYLIFKPLSYKEVRRHTQPHLCKNNIFKTTPCFKPSPSS